MWGLHLSQSSDTRLPFVVPTCKTNSEALTLNIPRMCLKSNSFEASDPFAIDFMADSSEWELGIEGNFPLHKAVVKGERPHFRLSTGLNEHQPRSDAQWDESCFSRVLWCICLDKDCEGLRHSPRWETEKMLPQGKAAFSL